MMQRFRRLVRAASRVLRRDVPITREHVVWGYRLFLDREPESEVAVRQKLDHWESTRELRSDFLDSPEFHDRNPEFTLVSASTNVIVEIDGGIRMFVDLVDRAISHHVIRGQYEPSETAFLCADLKPGDVVLDVGANLGYYTLLAAARVGSTGHVYAFEPFASHVDLLRRSLRENRFEDRVTVVANAVGERAGMSRLLFATRTTNSGGAYLAGDVVPPGGHATQEVEVVALDEVALKRPVKLVKIDIEGAEALAFRGAAALLKADRPVVLSELHRSQLGKVSKVTPAELIGEMKAMGYSCHLLANGTPGRRISDSSAPVQSVAFVPN